jgi:hypothetical protein
MQVSEEQNRAKISLERASLVGRSEGVRQVTRDARRVSEVGVNELFRLVVSLTNRSTNGNDFDCGHRFLNLRLLVNLSLDSGRSRGEERQGKSQLLLAHPQQVES